VAGTTFGRNCPTVAPAICRYAGRIEYLALRQALEGVAVRLDAEALQVLARWVADRVSQKLDLTDRGDQKGRNGIDDSMRRRGAVDAVVGKARASRVGSSRRRDGGK